MQNVDYKSTNLYENMKEKRKNSVIKNPAGLKYSHCEHDPAMAGNQMAYKENMIKLE